jgi:hypothetical protein
MQLTSEDGLGVPFVSLRLFTTAQSPRSASGQDKSTFLTAGWGNDYLPHFYGDLGVLSAVSEPYPLTVWTLGFNQFRLRPAIRASTDSAWADATASAF